MNHNNRIIVFITPQTEMYTSNLPNQTTKQENREPHAFPRPTISHGLTKHNETQKAMYTFQNQLPLKDTGSYLLFHLCIF